MNILEQENIETSGFIDMKTILKYVTEEDIFELVFGFKPKEYDYVVSPFRKDNNPGCMFSYSVSGKLRFIDFGSKMLYKNKKFVSLDCFDCVRLYYNLPNLYHTLCFIKDKLIRGKNLKKIETIERKIVNKKQIEILIEPRNFNVLDKIFWYDKYKIHKNLLIEDKIIPISKYKVLNTKTGDHTFNCTNISYCYTDFKSGHKKIYMPYNKKSRFITNCVPNDIGGINKISYSDTKLIITKSYKDYRVLKNLGLNSIWLQSETSYPDLEILLPIVYRYDRIIVFFDNDATGISSSASLKNIINSYFPNKAESFYIPGKKEIGKDPSDYMNFHSRKDLIQLLIKHKIL